MKVKQFDTKMLDEILEKMMDTVGNSKQEIFEIGERCRGDFQLLTDELKELKQSVIETIEEGDQLEQKARFARNRLSEVSSHFKDYSEIEVREVYEQAHRLQSELSLNRHKEKLLRSRRDDLERRLGNLSQTIERADHLVSQITVVLHYLTSDLKQIGAVIEDAKERQEFGFKIIEAQEEERKRVSREMHDGPAQMMANVIMRTDLIERIYREQGIEEAFKEIRSVKQMVRQALYEVRHIIYDLRPMALDDLGLVPALKKYLKTTEEYFNDTRIGFTCMGEEKRLPAKFEVAIFRLVQEAVQNAMKHAKAKDVIVKLEMKKQNITIVIKDNGKGFDTKMKKSNSFGLLGMKERVVILEGELSIDSHIGKGTVVIIQIPLDL